MDGDYGGRVWHGHDAYVVFMLRVVRACCSMALAHRVGAAGNGLVGLRARRHPTRRGVCMCGLCARAVVVGGRVRLEVYRVARAFRLLARGDGDLFRAVLSHASCPVAYGVAWSSRQKSVLQIHVVNIALQEGPRIM